MTTIARLRADAQALLPDAIALRRRLHGLPEIGLELPETQRAILEGLDGLGLEIRLGERLSSVVARLRGAQPGKTVLLRADMDALPMAEDTGLEFASRIPGRMHACGHDAHAAMLVGAARLLAARRERLHGEVVLMFQPGEEGKGGAQAMLDEGLLGDTRPDAAFALHVWPLLEAGHVMTRGGPMLASVDNGTIVVRGKGGHASMPHDAIDPIPIACEIVQAIQVFVSRRVNPFAPALVTVGSIVAGTTFNVIPASAELKFTMRAVAPETRALVREHLPLLASGIARAHGADAETTFSHGDPVTMNDPEAARLATEVAAELLGPEAVHVMPAPLMGSEDFSRVLERVPGAFVFLGAQPADGGPVATVHSSRMRLDESALAAGMALHAALALRFLGAM